MSRMVKKTIELDQDYIDRARLIFEVRTEKEAVNKALEMAVIDNDIIKAHDLVGGKGDESHPYRGTSAARDREVPFGHSAHGALGWGQDKPSGSNFRFSRCWTDGNMIAVV